MWPPRVLPHFVALSGPKSAFCGSNLKLAAHRWAPPLLTTRTRSLGPLSSQGSLKGLAAHLELLSLVKHSPELFNLILYHLCGRLLPNERIGATETIPEVVNLTSLLADERCGAGVGFSLLQSFATYLLLGRQGHSHQPVRSAWFSGIIR